MSRTRELVTFTSLIAVATVATVGSLSILDLPGQSGSATQQGAVLLDRPAPVAPAQPVVDFSNAFAEAAAAVKPSVVYIIAEQRQQPQEARRQQPQSPFDRFFEMPQPDQRPRGGSGSGFIISPDGYIMTNNHVVECCDRFFVNLENGKAFPATVVGRDPLTDVAVIKIDGKGLPAVSLANSDPLRVGDWVIAVGSPLNLTFTVTAGIVSARGRPLNNLFGSQWAIADFIQTDAAINPGNSGGPLVNLRGQVVGINSAIASQTGFYEGYGFAIPINLARTVAEQLIKDGKVTRAALGVGIRDATENDAAFVGLNEVRGVTIHEFRGENSPAKRGGLELGDVIIAVDGEDVHYVAQLQQIVGFKRPGQNIDITVAREGGKRRTLSVQLIRAETADEAPRVAAAESERNEDGFIDRLGVSVEPVTGTLASQLGDDNTGLVVTTVDPDGPSRQLLFPANRSTGGLDIITHVNGQRVRTRADLTAALANVSSRSVVSLRVAAVGRNPDGQVATQSRIVRVRTN